MAGPSADSLLQELVMFGATTVFSRPHFEDHQDIYLRMHIRRLSNVDQKAQQYTLLIGLTWMWRDCRLLFDSDSVGRPLDIHQKSPLFSQIWTPYVAFAEEAHSTEVRNSEQFVLIQGDGMVTLKQTLSRQMACTFDFTKLPWDQQSCTVTAMLPAYTSDNVVLHWAPQPLVMDSLENSEWEISGLDDWLAREVSYDTKEPGPARTVSAVKVSFTLTRKSTDTVGEYIVTTAVYWFCSYCGFWVDPSAAPARVTLALIPILTLNNKMGQLRLTLPPVNKPFILGRFIMCIFLLSTVHLMEYGIVHFSSFVVARRKERHSESADQQKVVPLLRRRLSHLAWRFSMWAKDSLDFHSRWICVVAFFLICLISMSTP